MLDPIPIPDHSAPVSSEAPPPTSTAPLLALAVKPGPQCSNGRLTDLPKLGFDVAERRKRAQTGIAKEGTVQAPPEDPRKSAPKVRLTGPQQNDA
jgi:hypothetical protein